jgi:hypothetical protein
MTDTHTTWLTSQGPHQQTFAACLRSTSTSSTRIGSPRALATSAALEARQASEETARYIAHPQCVVTSRSSRLFTERSHAAAWRRVRAGCPIRVQRVARQQQRYAEADVAKHSECDHGQRIRIVAFGDVADEDGSGDGGAE